LLLGKRRFHHRPIDALPAPGDAFHLVILGQPGTPFRLITAIISLKFLAEMPGIPRI
jgi:hypothetical protein